MSSDLVRRLREPYYARTVGVETTCNEAADRIEALEGEVQKSKADYQAMKAWAEELHAKNSALEVEIAALKAAVQYPCSPICAGYLRAEAADARAERLRVALQGLHDDVDDYQRVNNLSGHNNHWMVIARKALEDDKQ